MSVLNFILVKFPYKLIELTLKVLPYIYIFIVKQSNNLKIGRNARINGFPKIIINNGKIVVGKNLRLNSGKFFNPIGRNQRSLLFVRNNGKINIGDNVGMSSVAIVCEKSIRIGNNVMIGGNVIIYDTDFHSLNLSERTCVPEIKTNIGRSAVNIGNNVFIGAHSLILKGVIIGDNSIIGAGSVVTKPVPENEIWAGNPAKFLKKIH